MIRDAAMQQQQAERRARIPDEPAALRAMMDGWIRLTELGWRSAMHAPRGVPLDMIEVGSPVIHRGYRDDLGFWIDDDDDDPWPSRPCLFRLAVEGS